MTHGTTIAALRRELGLTLEQFGEKIGLASKGNVSMIERDGRCSVKVALAIEALSGGRISAAALNSDVALVEAARSVRFAALAVCPECDVRAEHPAIRSCTSPRCPMRAQEAA